MEKETPWVAIATQKVKEFLRESGMSAYDLMRIGKSLCTCEKCKKFVQHYDDKCNKLPFGHCERSAVPKHRSPDAQSCGFWEAKEEE